MERMKNKYANIDELIEQRYRQYVLEQQMLMQMRKKKAGGSSWLQNLSEMDRRAEEKRMIMKMRAAEHAKKRADARAAEEAAAEEKRQQIEKEKKDRDADSDDDGPRAKPYRPKIGKLKLKGFHKQHKETKPHVAPKSINQPNDGSEKSVISNSRMKELLAAARARPQSRHIRIRAIDVSTTGTSTDDLEDWCTDISVYSKLPDSAAITSIRAPTPMPPIPRAQSPFDDEVSIATSTVSFPRSEEESIVPGTSANR